MNSHFVLNPSFLITLNFESCQLTFDGFSRLFLVNTVEMKTTGTSATETYSFLQMYGEDNMSRVPRCSTPWTSFNFVNE